MLASMYSEVLFTRDLLYVSLELAGAFATMVHYVNQKETLERNPGGKLLNRRITNDDFVSIQKDITDLAKMLQRFDQLVQKNFLDSCLRTEK